MVKDPFPQHQEQHCNACLTTCIQNYSVYSGQNNQARKRNKKHPDWEEEVKLFSIGVIFHMQKILMHPLKIPIKTNKFNKVSGNKINIQQSFVFPYSISEQSKMIPGKLFNLLQYKNKQKRLRSKFNKISIRFGP